LHLETLAPWRTLKSLTSVTVILFEPACDAVTPGGGGQLHGLQKLPVPVAGVEAGEQLLTPPSSAKPRE
jgi:hypothetical protein